MTRALILSVDHDVEVREVERRLQQVGVMAFLEDWLRVFQHGGGEVAAEVLPQMVFDSRIIFLLVLPLCNEVMQLRIIEGVSKFHDHPFARRNHSTVSPTSMTITNVA